MSYKKEKLISDGKYLNFQTRMEETEHKKGICYPL